MKKLLILLILFPLSTHALTWDFITGGELQSVTDGVEVTTNSAPIANSTTQAHSGSRSYRVNAGAGFQRQVIATSNQAKIGTIRVWVYIVAAPNAATQMIRWSNASNVSQGNITLNTDRTLTLLKVNGTQIGSASSAIPLNTWTCVEMQSDATGTGTMEGRVNGVSFASGANSAQGTWARALWGNVTGAQTTNDMYFDDIAVTEGSGYPGCGSTKFLQPNGAGDATQFTKAGSSPAATNYQSVNELPPDDAVTLVNSATVNQEDLYNFTDSGLQSYDTVNAVVVGARYNNDTADATTAYKVEWLSASGGTKAQSSAFIPNSTTWTSYGVQASKADINQFSTTTDSTGAALTNTKINNMQSGYIISTGGTNKIQFTNLWSYVDYTAGTAPVSTGLIKSFFIFGDW